MLEIQGLNKMSITGSLVGYENNNDISKKNRSLLNITATSTSSSKQCQSLNSSISNSVITTASSHCSSAATIRKHRLDSGSNKHQSTKRLHLNTLWSIWYGVLITFLQGYLVVQGAHRYLGLTVLTWKIDTPNTELDIQIIFCALVVLFLPLFLAAALFKVGNLANDGVKLATGYQKCSSEPSDGLEEEALGGTMRALWTHGGPTSAFIHIITAICLLLPRLLLEAKLIENGLLPRDDIWRTDMDFMVVNNDRLVVLSFMTAPYQNVTGAPSQFLEDLDSKRQRGNYFEKTHLIESISDYDDDDDLFGTHQNMEMEIPPSLISISTMENFNINDTPTTIFTSSSTKLATTTTKSTSTTPTIATSSHSSASPSPFTMKMLNIAHEHLSGSGKKNKSHSHNRKHSNKSHNNNNNKKEKSHNEPNLDDTDLQLELKPEKEIDFDKINEQDLTTLFEVNRNRKSQQSVKEKVLRNESGEDKTKTNASKKGIKDSEIHIFKPVKLPDNIIPSTPVTTNSKIIEIKPSVGSNAKNTSKKNKRFSDRYEEENVPSIDEDSFIIKDENGLEIRPSFLIGAVPGNISTRPIELKGFAGFLQSLLGLDQNFDASKWTSPPSLEFINLAIAVMVWSVRYPSVFWGTSKSFALVFSIQMIANSIDILLSFAGASVLYKLQSVGQSLPLQSPALILNATVTIALTILSIILIISSSMVLYLYGHGRLAAKIRDRRMITMKQNGDAWSYFAHCASLCFVLALAVVKAPLMHDLSATYRGSLDGAVLGAALGSVIHLFLWVVLWLGLTAKRRWSFKLPPLEQMGGTGTNGILTGAAQPLLLSPRGNGGMNLRTVGGNINGDEETIYWPKIAPNSPKLKVTFNEVPTIRPVEPRYVCPQLRGKLMTETMLH